MRLKSALRRGVAKVGQRVLLVDLDPQGNATMGVGLDKRQLAHSVYDVLLGSASVTEARVRTAHLDAHGCAFDVLGANRELAGAEVELVTLEQRERRLKTALAAVVVLPTPPFWLAMQKIWAMCTNSENNRNKPSAPAAGQTRKRCMVSHAGPFGPGRTQPVTWTKRA
jgi:hypothetical protein